MEAKRVSKMFEKGVSASKGKYQLRFWLQVTSLLEKTNLLQGCEQLTESKEMLKALAS